MSVTWQVQDSKFRLEDNGRPDLAPELTTDAQLCWPMMQSWDDCGTIQTQVLSSVPVSLDFCDTRQHPAITPLLQELLLIDTSLPASPLGNIL